MPILLVLAATLVAAGAAARSALVLVTVRGRSMAPTLTDGDRVLVLRRRLRPVRAGDVVAARLSWPPGTRPGLVVKRVAATGTEVYLLGDNAADSGDSRLWGALPVSDVVGVVVARLNRKR